MPTTTSFTAVTATPTKTTYASGEQIKITVAGSASSTETTPVEVEATLKVASGATGKLSTTVNVTRTYAEPVTIVSATDGNGRTYTVSSDGKSITAVA